MVATAPVGSTSTVAAEPAGTTSVDYNSVASLSAAAQAGLPTTNVTQAIWATFLLFQVRVATGEPIPITLNNIHNIELWMTSEEPATDWFRHNNPLNINAGGSGSDTFPNLTDAANTTASTIANYPGIVAALNQDAPTTTFIHAVSDTTNTGGHYWASGQYDANGAGPGSTFARSLPPEISAGTGNTVLPADPGAATPGLGISVGGWLGSLETILGDLSSASWWKRVGIFSLGGVLIIGGVILFVSTTKTGQTVKDDAPLAAAAVAA